MKGARNLNQDPILEISHLYMKLSCLKCEVDWSPWLAQASPLVPPVFKVGRRKKQSSADSGRKGLIPCQLRYFTWWGCHLRARSILFTFANFPRRAA